MPEPRMPEHGAPGPGDRDARTDHGGTAGARGGTHGADLEGVAGSGAADPAVAELLAAHGAARHADAETIAACLGRPAPTGSARS